MASLKYTVDVDTRGARSSLASLERSLGGLGAAVAGGFAIGNIVAFGDSIIGLQNKLRSLTGSSAEVASMFNDITRIAGAARAPLQETGDLYFRIARAADDLGISQQQTASITESLAKSMSMTGATAAETSGALLQLGQALQSGRFQGDELRSVLENMPIVAKAMADELGVTIGELRKLGSEGKITSDVFVRAMEKNKKAIDDAFARSVPTAQQALNNLKTAAGAAFAELATDQGPAQIFIKAAGAVLQLTNNVNDLKEIMKDLAQAAIYAGVAFLTLGSASPAIKALQAVFKGLQATLIFLGSGGILRTIGGGFAYIAQQAAGAGRSMTGGIGKIFGPLAEGGKIMKGTADAAKKAGSSVGILGNIFARVGQVFFSVFNIASKVLKVLFRFAGPIGVFFAIAQALDFFLKKFLGVSIVDWAWEKISYLWEKLKQFYAWVSGTEYKPPEKMDNKYAPAAPRVDTNAFVKGLDPGYKVKGGGTGGGGDGKSAKETAKEQAEALREVKKAILEITAAFRELAASRLDDLKFQLASLDMSEDQVQLEQNRRDIMKEQNDALKDLAAKELEVKNNKDLSNKGRQEALALIAQERATIQSAAAENIAATEAEIRAIQKRNLEIDAATKKMELLQQANENRASLEALEAQLTLVGLYGDKLDDATAQLELQNKLREIDVQFQNQLLDLENRRTKLGEERYAMELANIQAVKAQAVEAANAQAGAQKKLSDAIKKSERTDVKAAIGKRAEEMKRSIDPVIVALDSFNSVFDNMGNALDNFIETGKFKFGDFARSIILDLAKIAAKAALTKIFSAIGGSLFGKAAGGPVQGGKPYLVGEQGPELFVPNSNGSIMTNASLNKNAGMGGSAQPVVNNTYITNNISAIDSRSVAQMFVENRKSLLGATTMARKELPYS